MQKVVMFLNIKLRVDDDCQTILPQTVQSMQHEYTPTLELSYAYLADEFTQDDAIPTDQGGFSALIM